MPSKLVAIIVPLPSRSELTPDEKISMRHLVHYLGSYDKYLIAPCGTDFRAEGFSVKSFSSKYFGSMRAHSRLLYSPAFWRAFEDYEYVLMYHLDALVFRDELVQWCEAGIDYIGAPFIPCADTPDVKEPRVGNGGFALMKVESLLRVLHFRYRSEPLRYWEDCFAGLLSRIQAALRYPRRMTPRWLRGPLTQPLRESLQKMDDVEVLARNNDKFWSYHATKYLPDFSVPDWQTGLRFAFEAGPRICYELNGSQLPFGCHAWPKYDRAFWAPFLLDDPAKHPGVSAPEAPALSKTSKEALVR
ncbi:MAG TPA: DUF5672 family protein [Terrimicrobiaceae bacterium]